LTCGGAAFSKRKMVMRIEVKSIPENWEKEKDIKPNTIRILDGKDIIAIKNTVTGQVIEGIITDITNWKGIIDISYKDPKVKIQ
jgi:hypothetical protein